jgi:peptidyl-prolyl cis-trans isomerase B (cyclophilin B)
VSPISREREYARRRYEKWQSKQAVKRARQRRQRRVVIVSGAAVVVVLAISGVVFALTGSDPDTTTATPAPTTSPEPPAASPDTSPEPSTTSSASTSAGPNPCPVPTVKPPATPQSFTSAPDPSLAQGKTWTFTITTSCGDIVAELDGAKAPKAVANTVFLSGKKFWDGSPCHRMTVEGLRMLQCGDPTGTGTGGPGYGFGPPENAPADKIYKRGVLAMARTSDLAKGQGSQFFLVFGDSPLDGDYTVFGKVTKGLDILDKVAAGGVTEPDAGGTTAPVRKISIVRTSVSPG